MSSELTVDTPTEANPIKGDKIVDIKKQEYEFVDHPKHYNSHPSGVECIDVVRHMNFNVGSAMKYLWRSGIKPGEDDIQDLEKAIWYLQDEVKRLKNLKK